MFEAVKRAHHVGVADVRGDDRLVQSVDLRRLAALVAEHLHCHCAAPPLGCTTLLCLSLGPARQCEGQADAPNEVAWALTCLPRGYIVI